MRSRAALRNSILGFVYEIANVVCSLILPRFILTAFGSDYNGLINAVGQFLAAIGLLQAGIGSVTIAALYRPLSNKDTDGISGIIKATSLFLQKICFIFLGFVVCVSVVLGLFFRESFDFLFTVSLCLIMAISVFMQYFLGQTYKFLLRADQKQGFIYFVDTIKIILNTIIAVILINCGFGIQAVKLGSALVFAAAPVAINIYAKRKYKIIKNIKSNTTALSQRWDNFGREIASFVSNNTDLIILSAFSNPFEISVYAVYNMVANGVMGMFKPLVNGVDAAFGNMFAKNEDKTAAKNLLIFEQLVFAAATFLFGVSCAVLTDFVGLYTKDITDVNYIRTIFAYLLILTMLLKCYRTPYEMVVTAAGHFKQNRNAAFIEAGINIALSLALVIPLGICGVIIGTLCAFVFRTANYITYVGCNIIKRSLLIPIKRIILSLIGVFTGVLFNLWLSFSPQNWMGWILNASIISCFQLTIVGIIEISFYRDVLKMSQKTLMSALKRKK